MKKVAIILSGCGMNDGSEIHEAVLCLLHLTKQGASYQCFAPDKPQATINHITGQLDAGAQRNVLTEAARISRGDIKPLSELKVADFDALLLPGGFGVAKNLSNFASQGADMQRFIIREPGFGAEPHHLLGGRVLVVLVHLRRNDADIPLVPLFHQVLDGLSGYRSINWDALWIRHSAHLIRMLRAFVSAHVKAGLHHEDGVAVLYRFDAAGDE